MNNTQQLLRHVSRLGLLIVFLAVPAHSAVAQVWTVLAGDAKGDARDPALPDAAQLAFRYEKQQDYFWFRISFYSKPPDQAFGINLVFDTGSDEAAKMNWWGGNKTFRFDKLVTAWVTRSDSGYQGTIGIGDPAGVNEKRINNLVQDNLQLRLEDDAILIGVKRTDINDKMQMKVIAAVGSNKNWNDDVPNSTFAVIDLAAERPKRGLGEIDLSRNNLELPVDYLTLRNERPPVITRQGQGEQAMILVPGMYSGAESFAGFIARNQSRYKMFLLTPPGINGSPARSLPTKGPPLSELTWTHLLERDILNLISKEKLSRPVIVAERQPASVAAMELAINHPDEIGGVILAGTSLVQFFPSPKDPTRKTPVTLPERIVFVDEAWALKWFKYVTPETWKSNDMTPEMLSSEPARGQKAWQEIEATPIQINIRYLCEFWASDVTRDFDRLQVPVMALIPGFDEKFLADPANAFAKTAFVDSWETQIPKHPKLAFVKIPQARLLVFEDQPKLADGAVASFMETVRQKR